MLQTMTDEVSVSLLQDQGAPSGDSDAGSLGESGPEEEYTEEFLDDDDEYMIYENSPITNIFVSVPDDMGSFNCAAFLAGIISGILMASNFDAKVTAHTLSGEAGSADRTVFLVKFSQEVMGRPGTL